jgi:hypothetical protein
MITPMSIDKHRAHLTEMRAIATDQDGREVLVGLTFEETEWYFDYQAQRLSGQRGRDHTTNRRRFLALYEKHEQARLQVIGAEFQKQTDNPTSH